MQKTNAYLFISKFNNDINEKKRNEKQKQKKNEKAPIKRAQIDSQ